MGRDRLDRELQEISEEYHRKKAERKERAERNGHEQNGRQQQRRARTGPPRHATAAPDSSEQSAAPELITVRAHTIRTKPVEWLWPGRIPLGKLTTFAGQTSQGKTFVACDISARVTRGLTWPDGRPAAPPGQVLYITGDDDIDDTLVPRMSEAGADLELVVFLTEAAQASWTIRALATLDRALAETGPGVELVVIDPPTSFLGDIDEHRNAEVRAALTPFKDWARKHNVAVILITHVNKASGQHVEAMQRVMGSAAWVTGTRAAYMFAADPSEERQLFLSLKNNLGPKPPTLAYRIIPGNVAARVEWLGEVSVTADEAVRRGRGPQPSRACVASEWLIEMFTEKLEWDSEVLFARAAQEGISRNAIFEAKRTLNLPKARQAIAQNGDRSWLWWVPEHWQHLPRNEGFQESEPIPH